MMPEPIHPTRPTAAGIANAGAKREDPTDAEMREGSRVSGCAWNCFRRMTTGEADHGYCSHCRMVAEALQDARFKAASSVDGLTVDERETIAQGIEHFIIGTVDPDPDVESLWQPYVDKLRAPLGEEPR